MACFNFLSGAVEDPGDPGVPIFFPYAIHPDGDEVYGGSITGVDVYTWPGLTYVSSPYATSGHVTIDPSGNVYHQENSAGTTTTIYKNGSVLTTITIASSASGGGLAFADGWLWTLFSTNSGTDSGSLYRIDPSTGSTTAVHSVTGGRLSADPYAATDGAIWYVGAGALAGTLYRHDSGSTASTPLAVVSHFIPRPGGVMLARTTGGSPTWVDIATDLTSGTPSCDPTSVAGASPPPTRSFSTPNHSDVAFVDAVNDIYRAEATAGRQWWVGVCGWAA